MERNPSDSSTSGSRFKKFGTAIRRFGSKSEKRLNETDNISLVSDKTPQQKFVQELDAVETVPKPAKMVPKVAEKTHESVDESKELHMIVRSLREHLFSENGPDAAYDLYVVQREHTLDLCATLLEQTRGYGAKKIASSVHHQQPPLSQLPPSTDFENYADIATINELKKFLERLREALRMSLVATYKSYKTDASREQLDALLKDIVFRDNAIRWLKNPGNSLRLSESPEFWIKYKSRFRHYDRVNSDLERLERLTLISISRPIEARQSAACEHIIASNGDTILEFQNSMSPAQPALRFRVSSSILAEASPYFARIFTSSYPDGELLKDLPPAPICDISKDGSMVNLYRMPQTEQNKWNALTILLHAAHHHSEKVPKQIQFHEFVSIAEVCLRYQCTAPLEMAVEYRWLPQWIHKVGENAPDGILLISYCFGLRRLFTRASKSAILDIIDDDDLQSKVLWPEEIKRKISAVRDAKVAQIQSLCVAAIEEYQRPPQTRLSNTGDDGAFEMSSPTRCPQGSRQCDATNLGWLMLMFNELEILPGIMNTVNGRPSVRPPSRSIRDFTELLGRIPNTPHVHGGLCDHTAELRANMNDVYNSITGLTFWDVCGKGGWALSKHHDTSIGLVDEAGADIFELPALVQPPKKSSPFPSDETLTLRILSHIDNLRDLQSLTMANKSIYSVYKAHELTLIKSILKASRKRTPFSSETVRLPLDHTLSNPINHLTTPYFGEKEKKRDSLAESIEDLCASSTPPSPMHTLPDILISPSMITERLTGHQDDKASTPVEIEIESDEFESEFDDVNEKYLPDDRIHLEKSLTVEGKKHLRSESDQNLRRGLVSRSTSSS